MRCDAALPTAELLLIRPVQSDAVGDRGRGAAAPVAVQSPFGSAVIAGPAIHLRAAPRRRGAAPGDRRPFAVEQQLECRESVAEAIARRDAVALASLRKSVESMAALLERELAEQLDLPSVPAEARVSLRKLKFLSKVAADIGAAIAEIDD